MNESHMFLDVEVFTVTYPNLSSFHFVANGVKNVIAKTSNNPLGTKLTLLIKYDAVSSNTRANMFEGCRTAHIDRYPLFKCYQRTSEKKAMRTF